MFLYRFLLVLFIFVSITLHAQINTNSRHSLKGLVLDDISGAPLPYVNIKIVELPNGTTSTKNGRFTLEVKRGRKVLFSAVNYTSLELYVPDSIIDLDVTWIVRMQHQSYQLNELEITKDKALPLKYRSEVFQEKPTVYNMVFQPISYFYYRFSKKEKNKRELVDIIEQDRLKQQYAHILSHNAIAQLTGFQGLELQRCLMYCNARLIVSEKDTDSMVRDKLLRTLSNYYKSIEK